MILGPDYLYFAKAMKICRSGFKEGQYSVSVQLCTETLSGLLGKKRFRFETHQKVVVRAVVGKEFCKPVGKCGNPPSNTATMRSAK
jgi:hypothetical protein